MPKIKSKASAEKSAVELSNCTPNSHIEENQKSFVVKVGVKKIKSFPFEGE